MSRTALLLFVVASIGVVGAVFAAPYFATHDGPQHLYLAQLATHFSDPGAPYPDFYTPGTAITGRGFGVVYAPLTELMPWRTALGVTISCIALLFAWGVVALARAVNPARTAVGVFGFALALPWTLFMGFFAHVESIAIGLFIAAFAFSRKEWSTKDRAILGGLLLVQAFCHVFGAELMGVFLGLLVLFRTPRARWPRELGLLFVMGIPVLLIGAIAAGFLGGGGPSSHVFVEAQPTLVERVRMVGSLLVGGPAWRSLPLVALSGLGLFFGFRHFDRATPEERTLAVAATLFFLVGVLSPIHLPQWEYFSPRFLAPAAAFALVLLPVERLEKRRQEVSLAAAFAFVMASIAWAGWFEKELNRRCADAFAGFAQPLERKSLRLPIPMDASCGQRASFRDAEIPFLEPAGNLGPLYAISQGGIVPYTFTLVPRVHGFVLRDDVKQRLPPVPQRGLYFFAYDNPATRLPPDERLVMTNQIAADGSRYEDVILHGAEAERRVFLERGFVSDFTQGNLAILSFRGCTLSLELASDTPIAEPVNVEYAWYPADRFFRLPPIPADKTREPVKINGAPCGKLTLRATSGTERCLVNTRGEAAIRCLLKN